MKQFLCVEVYAQGWKIIFKLNETTRLRSVKPQVQSVIIGLTKDTKAISVIEKIVHLQNHIGPVLPLCAGPIEHCRPE